jgi:hypothetical protein
VSACRSCGAEVEWSVTAAFARRMPLDVGEHADGNCAVVGRDARGAPIVVVLGRDDLDRVGELGTVALRRSHFQTCPEGEKWRR